MSESVVASRRQMSDTTVNTDRNYNMRIDRKSLLCEIDCKMSDVDNGHCWMSNLKPSNSRTKKTLRRMY